LTGSLSELTDSLTCALTDPLSELADGLTGSLSDLLHGPAGALSDVLDGALCALPNVLDGTAGTLAHILDGTAGTSADLLHCPAQALDQFRVSVQRRQHPVDDRGHVVKLDLEQGLRLDALYVELQRPELGVRPDAELDEVEHLGVQGYSSVQIVELELNLVDLDHRDVEKHVLFLGPDRPVL
jgi:hypothetical protein